MQERSIIPNVKNEVVSGSQVVKLICVTCVKKHFGKCLAGTCGCFICCKNGHKVWDSPTIAARGWEAYQVSPTVPEGYVPWKNNFYNLRDKGTKADDDAGKL